jgi:hypothetical protein
MTANGKSYEKVHYEFRPAKQVERRMLLDLFQRLMEAGYRISSYQYTGMGSIYFIDFVLFHRYLGIKKMVSVECVHEIKKRVHFNRPYGSIEIFMGDIAEYIPRLSRDRKHILWLDYDFVLRRDAVEAILLAAAQLSPGSFLVVTVDAEPPGPKEWGPKDWCKYFKQEAGDYLGNKARERHFAKSRLVEVNASIIESAIQHGLAGREDVDFIPLMNFVYADGHCMLTLGGMIGAEEDRRRVLALERAKLPFLRDSLAADPYYIRVPLLTRKERLHLDSVMPCRESWRPSEFEMKAEDLQTYREIHPYYPAYTEVLL